MKVHLVAAGKYHDIDFARLELLKLLAEMPQLRVTVASSYADAELIRQADLLITYCCDLVANPEETEVLAQWLHGGGRWLALHGTNSILDIAADGQVQTPANAPQFMELLGTQFAGHPPIGPFKVKVSRPDHTMTQGLRDFSILDELYLTRQTAPIDILMQTSFVGNCPEFGGQHWDEEAVPVLYERKLGEGAVLYLTLGHCRGHYDLQPLAGYYPHPERCAWNYPIFYELLRRGIRWGTGND